MTHISTVNTLVKQKRALVEPFKNATALTDIRKMYIKMLFRRPSNGNRNLNTTNVQNEYLVLP